PDMKVPARLSALALAILLAACGGDAPPDRSATTPALNDGESAISAELAAEAAAFVYEADRFADIRILRYQVPGFESLSLQQKTLLYYLSEAGMSGRDIMWDQNYRHNLRIRRLLEEIVKHYPGERSSEAFTAFMTYTKRVWFANGIHHRCSGDKLQPGFSAATLRELAEATDAAGAEWPLDPDQSLDELLTLLEPVLFDPTVDARKVETANGVDKVLASAVNFYEGVTEAEVTAYYAAKTNPDPLRPVSHGLNSKLAKVDGELQERVWRLGGMYSPAIERIVYWLEQAIRVAENDAQRRAFELLAAYYRGGDLADFDAYNVAWVADTE